MADLALVSLFFPPLDPVHVIGLYPHLLPSEIRNTVTEPLPTSPPTLSGDDLKQAIQCLITYLTQVWQCVAAVCALVLSVVSYSCI